MLRARLSIVSRSSAQLTLPRRHRYAELMRLATAALPVLLFLSLAMASPAAIAADLLTSVPVDDYRLYDLVVTQKFLTSETRLVLIDRLTLIRLHPEQEGVHHIQTLGRQDLFDGRLSADLIADFTSKNEHPSRLEARFDFGVPYRLIAGQEDERQETSLLLLPVSSPSGVQESDGGPALTIHLGFSRPGFNTEGDQALVYAQYERLEGEGAGFLSWLKRAHGQWTVFDTEVLWAVRPVLPEEP
ncbi:MAG TPA: hypothetical protein VFS39_04060 [Nitrospira sp.]|nr:hypothetical protein [Nitrospira sp.]